MDTELTSALSNVALIFSIGAALILIGFAVSVPITRIPPQPPNYRKVEPIKEWTFIDVTSKDSRGAEYIVRHWGKQVGKITRIQLHDPWLNESLQIPIRYYNYDSDEQA